MCRRGREGKEEEGQEGKRREWEGRGRIERVAGGGRKKKVIDPAE